MDARELSLILSGESPWGRLLRAWTRGQPLAVARPPRGARGLEKPLRNLTFGPRRVLKAEFPWEGELWWQALAEAAGDHPEATHVVGHLSESREIRRALAERVERELGLRATLRASYKSAFFWLYEEVIPRARTIGANRILVRYPQTSSDHPDRFLQALYPIAAILDQANLAHAFEPAPGQTRRYEAILYREETPLWRGTLTPPLNDDGEPQAGFVLLRGNSICHRAQLPTDAARLWRWFWQDVRPEILRRRPLVTVITARLSEPDFSGDSTLASMTEALEEDLYFTVAEALKTAAGAAPTDRGTPTGWVIPVVTNAPQSPTRATATLVEWGEEADALVDLEASPSITIRTRQAKTLEIEVEDRAAASLLEGLYRLEQKGLLPPWESRWPKGHRVRVAVRGEPGSARDLPPLPPQKGRHLPAQSAPGPMSPREIWATARALSDETGLGLDLLGYSFLGRPIVALSRAKRESAPSLLITAGQHANESTGPAAALRLARSLAGRDPLNLAVVPLENPDGAALHRALIQLNPAHMHHAARYTARGHDLQARTEGPPLWESAARERAFLRYRPQIHLNLHGYPAHEWTRPFSGYLPRGFEAWALPMGVLTILVYRSQDRDLAEDLAAAIASALARHEALKTLTQSAIAVRERHTSARPYRRIEGFPFLMIEEKPDRPSGNLPARHPAFGRFTVITEMPDETVYGQPFELLVEAHCLVGETLAGWLLQKRLL